MSVAETYNSFKCVGMVYTSSSEHGTTSGCEVQLSNASSYQQPELIPDPLCTHIVHFGGTKKVSRAMDLGSVT